MTDATVALRDAAVEEHRAGLCAEGLLETPAERRAGQVDAMLADLRRDLLACDTFDWRSFSPPRPTGSVPDKAGVEWATYERGPVTVHTITLANWSPAPTA